MGGRFVRGPKTAQGTRAIVTPVMWELWKHRNAVVFYEATPSVKQDLTKIETEGQTWQRAGLLCGEYDAVWGAIARWVSSE